MDASSINCCALPYTVLLFTQHLMVRYSHTVTSALAILQGVPKPHNLPPPPYFHKVPDSVLKNLNYGLPIETYSKFYSIKINLAC